MTLAVVLFSAVLAVALAGAVTRENIAKAKPVCDDRTAARLALRDLIEIRDALDPDDRPELLADAIAYYRRRAE